MEIRAVTDAADLFPFQQALTTNGAGNQKKKEKKRTNTPEVATERSLWFNS